MVERRRPEAAEILLDELHLPFGILILSDGGEEVAGIGEAVGADRPELGQAEEASVVLGDITPRLPVRQRGAKANAPGDERDLARSDVDAAHLGVEGDAPMLRDEEHLTV